MNENDWKNALVSKESALADFRERSGNNLTYQQENSFLAGFLYGRLHEKERARLKASELKIDPDDIFELFTDLEIK